MYELVYPNPIALSIDRTTGVITLSETIGDDVETTVNVSAFQHCHSDHTTGVGWMKWLFFFAHEYRTMIHCSEVVYMQKLRFPSAESPELSK